MKNIKYLLFLLILFVVFISQANALTCSYKFASNATLQCNVSSSVSCSISTNPNNVYHLQSTSGLNVSDFSSGCLNNIYIHMSAQDEFNQSNITINNIYSSSSACSSASSSNCLSGTYVANSSENNSNNNGTGGGRNGTVANNIKVNSSSIASETFSVDSFCTGTVQGVFTTLGWVIFILKIAVPLVLIIFGSIDLGKAVISNKNDEIKKSAMSLAKRCVAGIIIFFIPSIINLVVELIDNSNVYQGTFLDCTKCMLKPTNSGCSSLFGGN